MTNALSLITKKPADGILKLDFRAGIGTIPQLVFQPFKADRIALAVR